jgi:hypothetical protein
MLGAVAAGPAAANQRGDAVTAANDFIHVCFAAGGTPMPIVSDAESIIVYCAYDNGSTKKCAYSAHNGWEEDCWWAHPWVPNPDNGRGVDGGDQLTQGGAAGNPRPPVAPNGGSATSVGARSGDLDDGDQGLSARDEAKDEKHHKNKSKRHGKANGRHKGDKRR